MEEVHAALAISSQNSALSGAFFDMSCFLLKTAYNFIVQRQETDRWTETVRHK